MTRAADDFDGLTSAFLGSGSKPRPVARAQVMPTLLIVGNVPTLAGIWIAQYADQQARTSGPVALIRLDGAASRGEIYRAQGRALPTEGGAWMERASAFARSWIVCADCQSDPTAIATSGCTMVLLSGTDETAIAAAKRTIEAVAHASKIAGVVMCEIGLAFVGSSEALAQGACNSLIGWAAERSIAVRLSLTSHSPRVDRVESTGPVPLAMLSALDVSAALELIGLAMRGNPNRFSDQEHRVEPTKIAPPPTQSSEVLSRSRLIPKVSEPATQTVGASSALVGGVAHDYFPEWTMLAFVPPDAPAVQLAVDDFGTLHLIQSGVGANGLRIAAGWARANWILLCAASPAIDAQQAKILEHILLEDARDAALLHRTGVLLHARVDVAIGGTIARRRIDLNSVETAGITAI